MTSVFMIILQVVSTILDAPMQLLLAEILFLHKFPQRRMFSLRITSVIGLCILIEFALGLPNNFVTALCFYLGYFLFSIACMYACFKVRLQEVLFHCLAGYCLQNMAANFCQLLLLVRPAMSEIAFDTLRTITVPIIVGTLYTVIYLLVVRRFDSIGELREMATFSITSMTAVVLMLTVVINWVLGIDITNPIRSVSEKALMISCTTLLLTLQLDLLKRNQMQRDIWTIRQLRHQDAKRYQLEKENIELINMKCHDMRNILRFMSDQEKDDYKNEVERSAQIADTIYHTGNTTLDVLLTEKAMVCEKNGIQLSCIVDGCVMKTVSEMDLFSLMSNIFDNAIEATIRLDDAGKKVISLNMYQRNGTSVLHMENYFDGNLQCNGNLPKTSKKDKRYHGFGLKSVSYTVNKYNGALSISTDENIFILNLIIPDTV